MQVEVVTNKAGQALLQISETHGIGYNAGRLEIIALPRVLLTSKMPVKCAVNHFLACSCHSPFDQAAINELRKHMEAYLMPRHMSKEQVASIVGPAAVESFFPYWEPIVQENIEMATTKKAAETKPKAERKPKAEPKPKAERKPRAGIGAFCLELIAGGKTNDEILAAVQKKFPDAKTSKGCIAFYRNKAKAAA